jgi:malate dehydrogenase (oxaloacetate-decarboxylating)(NADP+)
LGVARKKIDIEQYKQQLEARLGKQKEVMRIFINKAKSQPKKIVFPEGSEEKILRACQVIIDEEIAKPILLGKKEAIIQKAKDLSLDILDSTEIIEPSKYPKFDNYVEEFFKMRQKKGVTRVEAEKLCRLLK